MSRTRDLKIDAVTTVITFLGRGLAGLSDRGLLGILGVAKSIVRDEAMIEGIVELSDVIKDGPPNTTTLKKMLKESKYDELRDFVSEQFFYREMDLEDF